MYSPDDAREERLEYLKGDPGSSSASFLIENTEAFNNFFLKNRNNLFLGLVKNRHDKNNAS